MWEWVLENGESPNGVWADTVVVKDQEVGVHTGGGLDNTNLQVSEADEFGVDQVISLGVSWNTVHDIKFRVFVSKGDGWDHVGTKINAQNKDCGQWEWNLDQDEEDEWKNLGNVG